MTAASVSRIPANAPKPQDRKPQKTPAQKAARVRKAEAVDGYVTVEQCGMELRIPVGEEIPLDVLLVFMGDTDTLADLGIKPEHAEIAGTRLLLGPEQWAEFRKKRPTAGDFNALGAQLLDLMGN